MCRLPSHDAKVQARRKTLIGEAAIAFQQSNIPYW
jgi:hypothetical protein